MKYFLHDTNAFNDEKITELFIKFGYEGLGLFYTVLEKVAAQEKPIKTSILKRQLQVGKRLEKCWSFMEEIGVISSSNGETFNERILSYSEKYKIQKEKNRERVAKFRKEHSENKEDAENVTDYETLTKCDSNAPKVKVYKVKERDVIQSPSHSTYKSQLLADQLFIEQSAMSWSISVTELIKMIDAFMLEQLAKEKEWKDYQDYKSHFFMWGKYDGRYNDFRKESDFERKRRAAQG